MQTQDTRGGKKFLRVEQKQAKKKKKFKVRQTIILMDNKKKCNKAEQEHTETYRGNRTNANAKLI